MIDYFVSAFIAEIKSEQKALKWLISITKRAVRLQYLCTL